MFDIIEVSLFIVWTLFVVYATWYFTSAKYYAPITEKEAKFLWKIHRHYARCTAKKWRQIKHKNETVGFECECGYKHIQKRPLIIKKPKVTSQLEDATPLITKKLHTTYERT